MKDEFLGQADFILDVNDDLNVLTTLKVDVTDRYINDFILQVGDREVIIDGSNPLWVILHEELKNAFESRIEKLEDAEKRLAAEITAEMRYDDRAEYREEIRKGA